MRNKMTVLHVTLDMAGMKIVSHTLNLRHNFNDPYLYQQLKSYIFIKHVSSSHVNKEGYTCCLYRSRVLLFRLLVQKHIII